MNYKEKQQTRFQCAVLYIVTIGITGIAIYWSIQQVCLAIYGIETKATVVKFERTLKGSFRTYRFTTETGRVIEATSDHTVGVGGVGAIVPIIYLPSHPKIFSAPGIEGCRRLFVVVFAAVFFGILSWVMWICTRQLK
jgi:hypothetical protein